MEQMAIVKRVFPTGVAEVALMRQTECGLSCKSCEGCPQKPPQEILALADNAADVAVGDVVTVRPNTGGAMGAAVLICLLPCIGLILGYMLGALAGGAQGLCVLAAFVGLVIGFVPAVLVNRAADRAKRPEFSIVLPGR